MIKQTRIATELAQVKLLVRRIQAELTQISPPKAERLETICDELQLAIESLREAA